MTIRMWTAAAIFVGLFHSLPKKKKTLSLKILTLDLWLDRWLPLLRWRWLSWCPPWRKRTQYSKISWLHQVSKWHTAARLLIIHISNFKCFIKAVMMDTVTAFLSNSTPVTLSWTGTRRKQYFSTVNQHPWKTGITLYYIWHQVHLPLMRFPLQRSRPSRMNLRSP